MARPAPGTLARFDRTERWLHWANATLVGVLVSTGAILYWGELSSVFGRRAMFKEIHGIGVGYVFEGARGYVF